MGIFLEATAENPYLPYMVGASVFITLMIALRVVFGVGKSRPHS